jgi:nucleolin
MPKKPVESSSSDSSSSDSEVQTKKTVTKKVAAKAPVSDSSSSDSDAPAPKKAAPKRAAPAPKSDSDSEDEKPAPKKVAAKAAAKPATSSSSESSDSDSDSEEEAAPVKKAAPKAAPETSSGDEPGQGDTIFVGGFPYDATEDDIRAHFGEVGTINSLRMPTFPDTGRFRGVAFITYASAEEAQAAVAKFDQSNFGARYLVVKIADGRPGAKPERAERTERGPSEKPAGCKTVFVGGLSFTASEDDLRACFDGCGTIVSARVAWDRDQDRSKGFGYIDFEEEDAVDAAIKLTGTDVAGRPIRVDYSAPRDRSAPRGGGFGGGRGRGGFGDRGGRGGRGGFGGDRGSRGGFGAPRRGGFDSGAAPSNRKITFN